MSVRFRTHTENEVPEEQPGFQIDMKDRKEDGDDDEEEEDSGKAANSYHSSINVYHLKDFNQGSGHITH